MYRHTAKTGEVGMRRLVTMLVLAGTVFVAIPIQQADAQWVIVARRVLGRVQHMQQDNQGGQPAMSVATVVLDAPAARVYAKAQQLAHANPAVTVLADDANQRRLEVAEGNERVTLSVQALSDKVSQLIIFGSGPPTQNSATARTVAAVMRVCNELKKTCSIGN
jgi:hypothetical protein